MLPVLGLVSTLVAELPKLQGIQVPLFPARPFEATSSLAVWIMALLDTFRYINFIKEEENSNSTEGKFGGSIPRYNGEPTRLGEHTWRVRATMAREAAMDENEVKKQGPLGLRLIEGLTGPALRVVQQTSYTVL